MRRVYSLLLLCVVLLVWDSFALDLVDRTVLKIDLNLYDIQTWAAEPWSTKSVWSQVEEAWWVAGINATYFCPAEASYARCGSTGMTDADRVVAWVTNSLHPETGIRWMFGFDQYGQFIFSQKRFTKDTDRRNTGQWYRANTNWDKLESVYHGISNFPILIDSWEIVTDKYDENLFWEYLVTPWRKGFICIDSTERYVYMWFVNNVTVHTLAAHIKKKYDCAYAINLDAWASTALYIEWRYLLWPWRKVPDGFIVVPKYPELFWWKDTDGDVVWWNSAELLWYQMTSEDNRLAFIIISKLKEKLSSMDSITQEKLIRQIFSVTQKEQILKNPRLKKVLQTVIRALVNS